MSEPTPPPPWLPTTEEERAASPGPVPSRPATPLMVVRLSAMMFLQFVPLGLWIVTLSSYIGANTGSAGSGMFDSSFVGIAGLGGAFGALVSPLLFGALADSWFRSERLMAVLNLACAGMLALLWNAERQWWFFAWMVLYFQCAVPALTLAHSLALRHLKLSKRSFPLVRAFGTGGWIAALWIVGTWAPWWVGVPSVEIERTTWPMVYAMAAHLLMAAYAMTLPATHPEGHAVHWRSLLTGCATLIKAQPRLVRFLIVSFCATVSAQFYNMYVNLYLNNIKVSSAATRISLGQVAEIVCMLLLPWLLLRWGPKRVFVIGVAAWALRYVCMAYGGPTGWPLASVYVAILLHGVCYAFVYVTGYIYVDHASTPATQSAAQGLLAMMTSGMGHLAGSLVSGAMQSRLLTPPGATDPPYDWHAFFLVAAGISIAAVVLFWLLMGFRREVMPGEVDPSDAG